jgi:GT2 family glycosyltransferase
MMADLTVIIPNFNGKHFLKECFESLQCHDSSYEVIVVDNASSDGSVDYIINNFPEFNLILNEENLGFSVAVNQGIKAANTEYVFLMNNDVVLDCECISTLLDCIKNDEKVFAVASKMLQYHDQTIIDDAGDEYTILGYTKKMGNGRSIELYQNEREIFSACAAASLYRRNVFEEIGYFDENFFAYMEDVDISYRARIYGYKCIYCPNALVYHHGSATTGSKYNAFKIRLAARNNVYVPYKNMPWPQLTLNLIFLLLGYLIKYLFFIRKGYGNDYIHGLKDGITSLDKIDKINFKRGRLINYLSIEWLLIKNTLKNIL